MPERSDSGEIDLPHPTIFNRETLVLGVGFAILGTIIGLELLTRVGITPNTSIIAAVVTIAVSRVPLSWFRRFRSLPHQNLMQTVISAATFGGANGLLLPAGLFWLMGQRQLIPVMLVGAILGVLIDAILLYRLFGTKLFPSSGLWPGGVATAECLIAGDRGGKRALLLGAGGVVGAVAHPFGIPMDVFGVCWIGNVWALAMFGIGLLVRGYADPVFGIDVDDAYLPHGFMIGAGLVALAQVIVVVRTARNAPPKTMSDDQREPHVNLERTLVGGFSAFAVAAGIMAFAAGFWNQMSAPALVGFVLFAAAAAIISEMLVGIAAMHAGWFPAFATALIFLLIGLALGFAELPLAFLVGFAVSTGPAFADMGYDLKAGFILRGNGSVPRFEREGRRAQLGAEILGIAVAATIVLLVHESYFAQDLIPPWDRVAAATIFSGKSATLASALLLWAVPGAVLQAAGGANRQLGVLFATGLLIDNPIAGWTAMAALFLRFVLVRRYGERAEKPMYVLAGGFIAGSALTNFVNASLRAR